MTILNVTSLDDTLSFDTPSDAKVSFDHRTTINGVPYAFANQNVTFEGVSIRYILGRIVAGMKVPAQVIERNLSAEKRAERQLGFNGRADQYVPQVGHSQPVDVETEFAKLPRIKQLEVMLANETDPEMIEILENSISKIVDAEDEG